MVAPILIIEDDPKWQERLKNAFETELGYSATFANSYASAVNALSTAPQPFEFVTVDLNLEGQTPDDPWMQTGEDGHLGLSILDYIQKQPNSPMCIVISAEKFGVRSHAKFQQYSRIIAGAFEKPTLSKAQIIADVPMMISNFHKLNKRIFISYRRKDSQDMTMRIYDHLLPHFNKGNAHIFLDVASINGGQDFRASIRRSIAESQVMLAVIGKDWLTMTAEDGKRRIDDRNDFVFLEIYEALNHNIRIIPVLVHGTPMPQPEDLPPDIRSLAFRNAISIRSDNSFKSDIEVLINQIETA